MQEKHYYESNLEFGLISYDLHKLKDTLINYFKDNSKPVFQYRPETGHVRDLWSFHEDGVSIHMQTSNLNEAELHFIDVKLVSEKTPTIDLEERLKKIAEQHKIN